MSEDQFPKSKVYFRDAVPDDAHFIAGTVMAAIGVAEFGSLGDTQATIDELCSRGDTLYSYKNARIATVEGIPVGCLISYPGDNYKECRRFTFGLAKELMKDEFPAGCAETVTLETFPGEYYLDSLAVLPAFRRYGIGKLLLQDGIEKGRRKGFHRITLIVAKEHPNLQEYYSALGFVAGEEIDFFGEPYLRMALDI